MKSLRASSEELEAAAELLRRRRARQGLIDFTAYTYPQYRAEGFHRLVASALDAVVEGRIRRLMVFAPPQHGKSELTSVRLPAYWLGRRPDDPVIMASYGADLAEHHSRNARTTVESAEYATLFPTVKTRRDSRAVNYWKIAGKRGGLLAAGVGGPITGRGAMLGIVDDPVENWQAAQSATIRESIWQWYRTTFRTRIWENGAIILVMTRWHEDDLAGRLLREPEGGWTVLRLPALAETQAERDATAKRQGQPTGQPDPLGRAPGEALTPGRFSAGALLEIQREVGSLAWNAEYQGAPTTPEGSVFKRSWFRYTDSPSAMIAYECILFDTAYEEKRSADYSAAVWCGQGVDGMLYVRPLLYEQMEFPDLVNTARQIGERYPGAELAVEARASGKSLRQVLRASGVPMIEINPETDKLARATSVTRYFEAGMVHFLPSPELEALEMELLTFPRGAHDDLVDACAYAILRCVLPREFEDELVVSDERVEISEF